MWQEIAADVGVGPSIPIGMAHLYDDAAAKKIAASVNRFTCVGH